MGQARPRRDAVTRRPEFFRPLQARSGSGWSGTPSRAGLDRDVPRAHLVRVMPGRVEMIALGGLGESLSALRLCSERERADVEHSLRRHGQFSAILCCRIEACIEVADGFKRVAAARTLGWSELRAEVREDLERIQRRFEERKAA